jgi:threonyl-tRNA synthetase
MTPVQARLVPVDDSYIEYCVELGEKMDDQGIRFEIDDRSMTLGKKIRSAEKLWIPYICVVGEKEKKSGKIAVRRRVEGDQVELELDEIVAEIHEKTAFAPRQRLLLPARISKQPVFSREV